MDATQTVRRIARLYQRIGANIILLLAFFPLVFFLVYFLLNSAFAGRVFDQTVNSMFRGQIGWTRVTWGPLPWELHVLEPVLVGPAGERVVTADAIHVRDIGLAGLFDGTIAARDIAIERPVVHLVQRRHPVELDDFGEPANVFNIAETFWPPVRPVDDGTTGSIVLDFSEVAITDAEVVLDMPGTGITAGGVNIFDGSFALTVRDGEADMRMGADYVSGRRSSVRVRTGDVPQPALAAPDDATLEWPFTDIAVRNYFWGGDQFGVGQLKARLRGDPVRVDAFTMNLDTPGVPGIETHVEIDTSAIEKHLRPLGVDVATGAVRLVVDARGELDAAEASFTVDCDGVEVAGVVVDRCHFVGQKDPDDHVELTTLAADLYGGSVVGRAEYDIPSGDAYAELTLAGVQTDTLPVDLDPGVAKLIAGGLGGQLYLRAVNVTADARRLSADGHLLLARSGGAVYGLGSDARLDLAAAFAHQRLDLNDLRLRIGGDRVSARGGLDLDAGTIELGGAVHVGELRRYTQPLRLPLRGAVDLGFSVRGRLDDPRIEARVEGDDLAYANFPSADVGARVVFANGSLKIDGATIRSPAANADVSGTVGVARRGTPVDLKVKARGVDLAALPLPEPVHGRATANITLKGPAKRLRIGGDATVESPRWRKLAFERLRVEGAWQGDSIEVAALELTDQGRTLVEADGSLKLRTQAFDARVAVKRLPLTMANHFVAEPLPIRGAVTVVLDGKGTIANPIGTGHIELHGIGYDTYDLGDGRLKVLAEGQAVDLSGRLFEHFVVHAAMPTVNDGRDANATVEFDALRVEELVPAVADAEIKVDVSGQVSATVDPFEGEVGQIVARLSDVRAEMGGVVLTTPSPVRLSFRHDVLNIDELRVAAEGQELGLAGTVGRDGLLDVDIAGDLDLRALQPFVSSVFTRVEGAASLWLNVSGPVDDPVPTGRLRLNSAQLVPRSSVIAREIRLKRPVELEVFSDIGPMPVQEGTEPVRGVFSVQLPPYTGTRPGHGPQPNRLVLRRDDGEIEVSRLQLDFVAFKPESVLVELDSDELVLNVPRTVRATAAVRGLRFEMWQHRPEKRPAETRLKLSGDIDLIRGEYTADISPTSEINQSLRNSITGRASARTIGVFERIPLLKRLMLDVRVRGDNDFFVRNQITLVALNLELRTDLSVSGFLHELPGDEPGDALTIDGTVRTLPDSKITYLRRDYEVMTGLAQFGPTAGGKFLKADIVAGHTFKIRVDQGVASTTFDTGSSGEFREEEVKVIAEVEIAQLGADPHIEIDFESSGGLSDIEIATLITTGSLPSDLSGASGAQPATEIVFGPLFGVLTAPIEDTLDLELTLSTGDAGTLLIDAEKLLSRRLKLYSRTPIGDDDDSDPVTFGLEYRLNNSTYGEVTNERQGEQNLFGARVRLRLDLE